MVYGPYYKLTNIISVHQPENDLEQIAVGRSHSKMVSSSKNGNSYLWRLFPNSKECFNIENRIHSSIAPDKIIISRSSPVLAINAAQVAKFSVHQFMPHCEHPCEDNHRNRISDIDTCEELSLVFKLFSISVQKSLAHCVCHGLESLAETMIHFTL